MFIESLWFLDAAKLSFLTDSKYLFAENNGEIIDVTITSGLTDVEKYILESIEKNSSITIKELSSESDYTVWQIRHYMDSLKNKGVLSRKGAQKNGEWIITSGEKRYE